MSLIPGAEPYQSIKGPVGVVLQHGFTGSPKSMKPWAKFLAKNGYSVSVPRLPGHGTTWQEMNKTRWTDWYAETSRAFDELRSKCDQVFIMGMSMGGALALRLAEERGDQVAGLVLINPALFTLRMDRHLLPYLRHIVPAFPGISNDIKKPGQNEGAYDRIPLQAAYSMSQLWSTTMKDIGSVNQPILVFTSRDDHVVENENSGWIMQHVPSANRRQLFLENSYHVATLDNDAELIFSESLAFIQEVTA